MIFLLVMMLKGGLWNSESKLVVELLRHLDLADRETDGPVHWKSMGPTLRHAFQKERGHTPFLILTGLNISTKGAHQISKMHKLEPLVCSRHSRAHWRRIAV